jgi:hypothetical protein
MEIGKEYELAVMPTSVSGYLNMIKNNRIEPTLETRSGRKLTKQESIEYLENLLKMGIKWLPTE